MDSTVSVSKGTFVFANGFKKSKTNKKKTKQTLLEKLFRKDVWYTTFKRNWEHIENELKEMNNKSYNMLLNDVVAYIKQSHTNKEAISLEGVVPSATLMTGISQTDHVTQFRALIDMVKAEVTPYVSLVQSQDASSVKHLVENVVWQLIKGQDALDTSIEEDDRPKLKKSQCNMKTLKKWYQNIEDEVCQSLVVMIPDFESFNCSVLQDFVMIVSSYVSSLPIILVFGVATSASALHKSFPYHVSSKLLIKLFHTHSSPVYMNQVLEEVFLTHTSPFHLSGKTFELLTDVFLFYDFSVTGLIQSIKYCMMEHYYGDNTKALCCEKERLDEAVYNLSKEELEDIRQLMSFRPYLEKQDCRTKIKLFNDDDFFRECLVQEVGRLHDYLYTLYLCVRLLCVFVKDMPKNVMGKSVREIYTKCAVEDITTTPAYKESMQLLGFQSQVKLVNSIKSALKMINGYLQNTSPARKPVQATPTKNNVNNIQFSEDLGESFAKNTRIHLTMFLKTIEEANTESTPLVNNADCDEDVDSPRNRYKLKEKLLKATRVNKVASQFEMVRSRFVSYLRDMFAAGLRPPHTRPFHELLFFGDVASVKKQIVGSPRGALHVALNNPQYYLQCSCCQLPADSTVASLPELSLAYKLHRECGKHINLYDWLRAFAAVLRPDLDDAAHQDAALQLRFTRAVAELQFLGFIKSSNRKTDHVMRLTW